MRRRLATAAALGVLALPATTEAAPGLLSIEGTFSYVDVRDRDGDVVVRRRPARPRVRMLRRLPAGVYRVTAGEARATRCSRRLHVFSMGLTEVRVKGQPRRRCAITRRAFHARFPPAARVRAARRYLRGRSGVNSWALIDNWGRLHGFAPHRVYVTASLLKAMLLAAYLRGIGNRLPDAGERALLGPMIQVSSNEAADAVYSRLGDAPLYELARRAGMRRFSIAGYWGNAHFSAEDQARLFSRIDRLVPKKSRAYARGLLSSIVAYQRWGFSRFSVPHGFRTFFKGGWRGTAAGRLVHEAALFERGETRVSMAVLTDGNPSHEYGTETLRGVAQRIFGPARRATATRIEEGPEEAGSRATRRAGLVDVHRFAPGIPVRLSYRTKHNETGRPLPSYCEDWALMHRRAAFSLGQVQRYLRRRGLGLLVLDAYRPVRATEALGPSSHTYNARGRILRNRLMLKSAMERFGFSAYLNEWWHFEHYIRPNRYLDVTLGCPRHN